MKRQNRKNKKAETRLDWLDRSLLTSPYCYALCLSEKDFTREMKRLDVPKNSRPSFLADEHCKATVSFFEETASSGLCCIVRIGRTEKLHLLQIHAILVHEAVHIWQHVKRHIGEAYPGDETEAYAIQRLAQSLIHSYEEQTKKQS